MQWEFCDSISSMLPIKILVVNDLRIYRAVSVLVINLNDFCLKRINVGGWVVVKAKSMYKAKPFVAFRDITTVPKRLQKPPRLEIVYTNWFWLEDCWVFSRHSIFLIKWSCIINYTFTDRTSTAFSQVRAASKEMLTFANKAFKLPDIPIFMNQEMGKTSTYTS